MMHCKTLWAVAALFLALPLHGDEIFLKNGRVLSGTVVEQTDVKVVIDLPAGRMSLPWSMIESVEAGTSEVSAYQERASALAAEDADGWLELAFWARDERLDTKSTEAFEQVLSIDPANLVAREVLGRLGTNDGADRSSLAAQRSRVARSALDRAWDGPALAAGDAAVAEQLDVALSLARDGRWAESAWRLRQVRRVHGDAVAEDLLAAVLFAVEWTAHSSNEQIVDAFSADEAHLERMGCVVALKFDDLTPPPWEWGGEVTASPDTVDLSGGAQLALLLPFRRAGQPRHRGTTDRLEEPVLLEGRFMEATGGGSLVATWRTEAETQAESHALLEITAEADGRSWGEVRSEWKEGVANYRKHQDLADGFFAQRRYVRAKVENQRVSFDVEGGFTEGLALPESTRIYLELAGDGRRSALDWISVSGPVDGLWLARRLAIRAVDP